MQNTQKRRLTQKTWFILLGAGLLCIGAAIDRGLNFVNWHYIKLGLMGEQVQICPTENAAVPKAQQEPKTSVASIPKAIAPTELAPAVTQEFRSPTAQMKLPALAPTPIRATDDLAPINLLGTKPPAANAVAKDKEKDEPAVNVDLTKGRKDSASNDNK